MKQSTKDNLIYLAVGLIVAGVLAFYIFYTDTTLGTIPDIPGPVLWGVISTPLIAALILEQFWQHRRRRCVWAISGAAALLNGLSCFLAYLLRLNPSVWAWVAMTTIWVTVAFTVASKVLLRRPQPIKNP